MNGSQKMKRNGYYSKSSELQPVIVQHDPRPNHSLKLYPFYSEEFIQWHLLRHGFVDCWVNPQAPNILSDLNNSTRNAIWKEFINIVKCPRWSIDFPKSKNEAKKQWEEALDKWTKIPGKARRVSGCNQCRKKNSDKQFITCYNFYEKYRLIFLKKIKAWIVETIQDNNCLYFYETGIKKRMNPKRKHVHIDDRTRGDLWAYITQKNNSGSYDLFIMKFQLSGIDKESNTYKFHYNDNPSIYNLKTVYGIGTKGTQRELDMMVFESTLQPFKSKTVVLKCHKTNW